MNFGAVTRDNLNLVLIAAIVLLTFFLARDCLFIAIFALSLAVVCLPVHRKITRRLPEWASARAIATAITGLVISTGVAVIAILLSD